MLSVFCLFVKSVPRTFDSTNKKPSILSKRGCKDEISTPHLSGIFREHEIAPRMPRLATRACFNSTVHQYHTKYITAFLSKCQKENQNIFPLRVTCWYTATTQSKNSACDIVFFAKLHLFQQSVGPYFTGIWNMSVWRTGIACNLFSLTSIHFCCKSMPI